MIDDVAAEKGIDKKTALEYVSRAESFDKEAFKYGFYFKENRQEGEYPFTKIPDQVTKLKEDSDEQLDQMIKDNNRQMQDLLKYEKAAVNTKNEASTLLRELENIKTEGHMNSVEYDEMHQFLVDVSNLGNGMYYRKKQMGEVRHLCQWDYCALATRIKEFAQKQKQLLDEAKPGFKTSVYNGIKNRNTQNEMIIREQIKRKTVSRDTKIEQVKTATSNFHNDNIDEMMSQARNIENIVIDSKKSNRKVHFGSSEFNRAIEKMQAASDAYKEWMAARKSNDKTLLRQKPVLP